MRTPTFSGNVLDALVEIEDAIKLSLAELEDELLHSECFDTEQRAEVYAIIQTLKHFNQNHSLSLQTMHTHEGVYQGQSNA